jgi:chromate transporter
VGVSLFYCRRAGVLVLSVVMLAIALARLVPWPLLVSPTAGTGEPSLGGIAALFTALGAFTFGGGLSMIALMQEHVVDRLHWLTPPEFVDGLALGQLMPGPIMMIAAYVGYKTLGITGAAVAAVASFVPSFVMMLALLPLFDRLRNLGWARAVIQGIVPAVVGVMAVALVRLAPYAAPDAPAIAVLVVTAAALVFWRLAPLKVMGGGTVFGILRAAVRA